MFKQILMRKSNYDKLPHTVVDGEITVGWNNIADRLLSCNASVIAIDLYAGTYEEDFFHAFESRGFKLLDTRSLMKSESEIRRMTDYFMTDDVLFGHLAPFVLEDFFDPEQLENAKNTLLSSAGKTVVIGTGAALVAPQDALLCYADMARWEIQQRFRRHEVKAIGLDDSQEAPSIRYKRGYFIDWKVLDKYKDTLFGRVSWWIDTNRRNEPKMVDSATFMRGIDATASRPFRVVPFFDPAPWGGQWMKEVCDLDRNERQFGWCFDCVPEENSLLLNVCGVDFEIPAVDLVLLRSCRLLGPNVEARFGKDFPIRFDFLDTMGGGNLSLQVHPTTQFVHDNFGIHYTQDESYYLLDAEEGATVYLGLRKGIDKDMMMRDLRAAQCGEIVFDAEKYVNRIPAKKHDHFLIPAGTVHCSGAGSMVLEISATPNIFTFKLWDWNRLGLDGKPRPINVDRGEKVIAWERTTDFVMSQLVNDIHQTGEGNGWREEHTGLHGNEFIETRRTVFSKPVTFETGGSVAVINLAEGEEAVVTSPCGKFEPFVVHYAETFIIPEAVGEYSISPCGASEGTECKIIRAYVRLDNN